MGLVPARDDDSVDQIALLLRRVDELERLGASRWSKPPTVAWGIPAGGSVAVIGASQTGITAATDITGATITFTAVAGRRYLFMWTAVVQQITASGVHNIPLTDAANTVISNPGFTLAAASFGTTTSFYLATFSAGSVTRKLRAGTNAGTLTILNGAANPTLLAVYDIGPV